MSWGRHHHVKKERKVMHRSRVRLYVVRCAECGHELTNRHLVHLFGERCHSCWQRFVASPVDMASH